MADDKKTAQEEQEEIDEVLKKDAEQTTEAPVETEDAVPPTTIEKEEKAKKPKPQTSGGVKAFLATKKGNVLIALAGIIVILAVLFAVPTTRYAIAGTVLKKDVTVSLSDKTTNKPISDVQLTLAGKTLKTNASGKATFTQVPVGEYHLTATKKYYKNASQDLTVPILSAPQALSLSLEATGRQVPVKVINKISGKPLEKAAITAVDTSATTDANGEAVIVLPVDKPTIDGTVKADGYNDLKVSVQVTEQKDDKNTFSVTPSGKLYFLSKRTGTINVMKSDLDGSNAQVVVTGTGKEEESRTILLASRDWKYLALLARRDSDKAKIYLIDTATDKMTVIDEGDAEFSFDGWHDHTFVYDVTRNKVEPWQSKRQALKAFNADTSKLSILDETAGEGTGKTDYAYEEMRNVVLLQDVVFFTKEWNDYNHSVASKKASIVTVRPDGSNKKVVRDFAEDLGAYFNSVRSYSPEELYIDAWIDTKRTFLEYEDGKVNEAKDIAEDTFFKTYPTYLVSPSGKNTFWSESRDGKNTLFIGDADGKQGKEVAKLDDYTPFGWYTDGYVLLSKKGSELYIAPASQGLTEKDLHKITDYHKPSVNFSGYGGGYGGL